MRKLMIGFFVAALFYSLVGCAASSDGDEAAGETEASASAEAEATAAELEAARAARGKCEEQAGGLLEALKQIDGRLDVGLTNVDFRTRLGDVAVTYNDIPFRQLSPECIKHVGVPLENAYNQYTKSKNKWDACIQNYSCSVEGAKLKELQRHWSKASKQVVKANQALSSPKKFLNPVQ